MWNNLDTNTTAQIEGGVLVNANAGDGRGGPVHVLATDNVTMVGVAGGYATSQHSGYGLTLAVNNLNRTTWAIIGNSPDQTPTAGQNGNFNISGLQVNAVTGGTLVALTSAAAVTSTSTGGASGGGGSSGSGGGGSGGAGSVPAGSSPQVPGLSVLANVGLNPPQSAAGGASSGADASATNGPKVAGQQSGTAASGDASLNIVQSDTEAYVNDPGTFNTGPAPTPLVIVTAPAPADDTEVDFAAPPGLLPGQAVVYQTTGTAIGGLTSGAEYYAIPVGNPDEIELASSFADALAGQAIRLDYSKASGTQSLLPISTDIEAATQTTVVSLGGGFALSFTSKGSNLGLAGAFSYNEVQDKTYAYLSGPTLTTNQLYVTATHAAIIGSLTAGAAGAAAGAQGNGAAGSVSVNLVLPDTEAYVEDATVNLSGDSNVLASDDTQIWAIAGAVGFGGKGGYGVAAAVNLIGFSWTDSTVAPATTLAYIEDSTVDIAAGTLTVAATSANPGGTPRIVAFTGAIGVGLSTPKSLAGAGMIAVNMIQDETEAYLMSSTVVQAPPSARVTNLVVQSHDASEIVAIGGAVGVGNSTGVGAAMGYSQISDTIQASLDKTTVNVSGAVTVTAESEQTIGGVVGGVGVSIGSGWGVGGSVSINIIADTVDAHISDSSQVTAGGAVSLSASDQSLIVAIAGGVSVSFGGKAVGASISYNRISNALTAYIADSIVHAGASVSLSATSSPLLVAVAAQGSASGASFAGAGTLTINSIANTVDAHISDSTVTAASGDVKVNSSEAAAEYVVALGIAGTIGGSALGASIAYNYLGGLSPVDPNVLTYSDGILPGSTTASVTADGPIPADTEIYLPNHGFSTGTAVVYDTGGGTPIGGLVDGQTYYVIVIDPNHIQLAASSANAAAGTAIAVSSTGSTSNQTFTLTKLQSTPAVTFNPTNSSISGNEIYLFSVTQSSGTLVVNYNVPLSGTAPDIEVSGSASSALFGNSPATTTSSSITGSSAAAASTTITGSNNTLVVIVNGTPLQITLASGTYTPAELAAELQKELNGAIFTQDGLSSGEELVYDNAGGTSIDGLTEGASYYIILAADNGIELAASQSGALSSPTIPVTLGPNLGGGTGHTLTPLLASSAATFGPAAVNAVITGGNELSFAADSGLYTGAPVTYHSNGGTGIGGLTNGSPYYVISVDATDIQLDPSFIDATSQSPTEIINPTSSSGTGTFTVNEPTSNITAYIDSSSVTAGGRVLVLSGFNNPTTLPDATTLNINPSSAVTVSGDAIHFASPDGLTTGQEVVYNSGGGSSIGGLTDGHSYYVIVLDPYTIKLAATYDDAVSGTSVQTDVTGVDTSTNEITLPSGNPGSYTGEAIVYNVGNGAAIGGLADGTTYYVISVDATHIKLADSLNDANNDKPITLTSAGTGTFTVATTSTPIPLSSTGTSSTQTIAPLDPAEAASINPSAKNVTLPGSTVPVVTVDVTQNLGTLTITSNDAQFVVTGGDAVTGLLGSAPTTNGDAITGSAAANLTITAGTNDTLDLTVNGTPITVTLAPGTYTADSLAEEVQKEIRAAIPNVTNAITFNGAHGFSTGQEVVYHNGGGTSIGGLTDGIAYFVIKVNDDTIQLASSLPNATASTPITLTSVGKGDGQTFTPTESGSTLTFGASAVTTTNSSADEISFATSPGLVTGDAVFYDNGGGISIGGLTDGQTYYVIAVDATHIKLASTFNNAVNDQPVFLTSPGTGANQSLVVKPTGFDLAGVTVALPIPISDQLVSVTAAGAGGTNKAGAGAVNLNFVRMNVDSHISDNSNVQAGSDVDIESSDTSEIGSGTGSVAISVGSGLAVNASVGLNDISNSVKAYVDGSTVKSDGAVNITGTETAQDINVVVGGAGTASGNAFGGSFAINYITNTVDAHIAASGGVGNGGTASRVTAAGSLSVLASDTASIATLAGNIAASLGGSGAGAAAVAVNDIADTDTATIDDSTAASGGAMTVNATFAKPTQLPPGLDDQIAAMSVSGAGASRGAFAGSLSLNWVDNNVEAKVSNIAAPQSISAGGPLGVFAADHSTIESLAGAIAIAGDVGPKASSRAAAAPSVSFNYLGGRPQQSHFHRQ